MAEKDGLLKPKAFTSPFGGSLQVWLGLAACGFIVLLGGRALSPSTQTVSGVVPAVGQAGKGEGMRALSDNDWQNDKEGDRCASQWRLDALVGRCFGLKTMPVEELKGPRWQDCRYHLPTLPAPFSIGTRRWVCVSCR